MSQSQSYAPPPRPEPATRHGQREIVAATLAAAVIASARERVTVEQAVEKMQEVMEVLMRG